MALEEEEAEMTTYLLTFGVLTLGLSFMAGVLYLHFRRGRGLCCGELLGDLAGESEACEVCPRRQARQQASEAVE